MLLYFGIVCELFLMFFRFLEFLPSLFSLLMTLAWVYSVCIIIKSIVYEKEKRLKEVGCIYPRINFDDFYALSYELRLRLFKTEQFFFILDFFFVNSSG